MEPHQHCQPFDDSALLDEVTDLVIAAARGRDRLRDAFPYLVREAMTFVMDPVGTARTRIAELDNVEKTFVALKIEHALRAMFDAPKARRDLRLGPHDVDVKNTVGANWSIPAETYRENGLCLLTRVDDANSRVWLGLFVARTENLNSGVNRDSKRSLSVTGRAAVRWLVDTEPLPPSRFAGLDMDRFRELRRLPGGNARAATFFRENLGRIVDRTVVEALLFDQLDPMKRVRANGGAHDILAREGVKILIGTFAADRACAAAAGIADLGPRDLVAVHDG